MSKTSVLMIDDEILALEHMKGLVDWNSLGYEIVGAVPTPRKRYQWR